MRVIIIIRSLFILLPLIAFYVTTTFGQDQLVDSLKYVKDMPYICHGVGSGCGDTIFWTVVRRKKAIVPGLIDRLADTTQTAAVVPNFGGQYPVADVAYMALQEIIKGIPTFDLLGVKFNEDGDGYGSYWRHLRQHVENRQAFRNKVKEWYAANEGILIWIESPEFLTCDCSGSHPNGGHYERRK